MIQRTGTASGPATGKGEGGDKKREGGERGDTLLQTFTFRGRPRQQYIRSFFLVLRWLLEISLRRFVHFFRSLLHSIGFFFDFAGLGLSKSASSRDDWLHQRLHQRPGPLRIHGRTPQVRQARTVHEQTSLPISPCRWDGRVTWYVCWEVLGEGRGRRGVDEGARLEAGVEVEIVWPGVERGTPGVTQAEDGLEWRGGGRGRGCSGSTPSSGGEEVVWVVSP